MRSCVWLCVRVCVCARAKERARARACVKRTENQDSVRYLLRPEVRCFLREARDELEKVKSLFHLFHLMHHVCVCVHINAKKRYACARSRSQRTTKEALVDSLTYPGFVTKVQRTILDTSATQFRHHFLRFIFSQPDQ